MNVKTLPTVSAKGLKALAHQAKEGVQALGKLEVEDKTYRVRQPGNSLNNIARNSVCLD